MVRLPTISFWLAFAPPSAAAQIVVAGVDPPDDPSVAVIYSYAKRARPAASVGSAASAITLDELENGQYVTVADALKEAPGVSLARNGGAGGFASVRLRGSSSGQTLVVIDGVVANDPAAPQGGYNFADLDVADIDRIEVLRGPQGIIYGADAIGGVIFIRTRTDGPAFSAYAEGGSRGTARAGATWRGGGGQTYARFTFSGATTDGLSRAAAGVEADGYRSLAASLSAGLDLGAGAALGLTARTNDARAEIDGFPAPTFVLDDTEEIEDSSAHAAALRLTHGDYDDDSDRLAGALTASWTAINRADADRGVVTFAAKGERIAAEYAVGAPLTSFVRIEAGGEAEQTSADVSGVDANASAGAVFALIEARPSSRLVVSAGARRDEFSNFDGATTARLAGVFNVDPSTRLRASWGEGFRAPTLFELNFDQFGVTPNPGLRPERARGFDVGLEKALSVQNADLQLAATFFSQRVEDQIDFDFSRNGYFNIDRVRSRGLEVELDAAFGERVAAHAVYTLTDTEDVATGAAIARVPRHSGLATLSWTPLSELDLAASLIFNGREADVPTANAAYARIDFRGAYRVSDTLELYARVENATDAAYQDVSGYAEPGVSAYAGLRIRRW